MICHTPEQTASLGRALAGGLAPGSVVALVGPLGAGKTQFVKGLAQGLGIDPASVTSPTFTLWHEYGGPGCRLPLFHGDFYRLESEAEAAALGLEEYFNEGGVTVVEWADKFPALLPPRSVWRRFRIDGQAREITECEL